LGFKIMSTTKAPKMIKIPYIPKFIIASIPHGLRS